MAPVALDTSVAVPLLLASHAAHENVYEWARSREVVLTRLPGESRLTGTDAVRVIDSRFSETLTLPSTAAASVHRVLAQSGIEGGVVYDGLVALTALEHGVSLASRDRRAMGNYLALGIEVIAIR